ncbi:Protein HIR [Mycena sanguinolenta]|uniref:Protein HIR n=1 Tax=Mycena sanguinolenta TaxID=230812 RepID=A0A8H6XDX2_9AGAR|nr:Protein HIR [Mycena sanguinolenta]
MSYLTTDVYCSQCDLYFVDVVARTEHIESSTDHPHCETCCRRFLNQNSLTLHLKCAARHLPPVSEDEELLDGDEVLLAWTSGFIPYSIAEEYWPEEDYWSSEFDDDSNDSTTSDSEPDSEHEGEHNRDRTTFLMGTESGLEYRELLFENLVDSSDNLAPRHC